MKVYIAGPMRGLPHCNFPAFDAAHALWKAAGHHPVSPANLDRLLGFENTVDGRIVGKLTPDNLTHTLFSLLCCVTGAEAIALLPGWQRSVGATMELAAAQFLGLPVYDAVTLQPMAVETLPWAWINPPSKVPNYEASPAAPEPGAVELAEEDAYTACGLARFRKEQNVCT